MNIKELLAGAGLKADLPEQIAALEVRGLDYDSRRIQPGFVFFAFAGAKVDGRSFAGSAMERGAVAVVSELAHPPDFRGAWIEVGHGRNALAHAARNFYGAPDTRLGITGITGTNGKTTTGFLVDAILRAAGRTTALIGTVEYRLAGRKMDAVNTTPESLDLYRIFSDLEHAGGTHVTMEVSSHALALGRVSGIQFHTALFTNLTRDHLDFHQTMENYFEAKQLLFTPAAGPAPGFAAINHDDDWGRRIRVMKETRRLTYGCEEGADLRATDLKSDFSGLHFRVEYEGRGVKLESALAGRMNVYNILAACAAALSYGIDFQTIERGLAQMRAVPGRFERIEEGQPFLLVVDYAHTDDALRNVISVARGLSPNRVITLFGCGGDRDRAKRPLMAMVAAELSDYVVVTSDNPRSEDPLSIINDVLVGLRRFDTPHAVEPDREKAIRLALAEARAGDIVIIAGKGHETYQVLRDRTIHFDDREIARAVLREMAYRGEK